MFIGLDRWQGILVAVTYISLSLRACHSESQCTACPFAYCIVRCTASPVQGPRACACSFTSLIALVAGAVFNTHTCMWILLGEQAHVNMTAMVNGYRMLLACVQRPSNVPPARKLDAYLACIVHLYCLSPDLRQLCEVYSSSARGLDPGWLVSHVRKRLKGAGSRNLCNGTLLARWIGCGMFHLPCAKGLL